MHKLLSPCVQKEKHKATDKNENNGLIGQLNCRVVVKSQVVSKYYVFP